MNYVLAAALVILALEPAAALQKAPPQDVYDIKSKIDLGNYARERSKIEFKKAADLEEKVKKNPKLQKQLDEVYEIANQEVNASIAAYRQALWLTIRAYDILPFADEIPIMDEGISVVASPEKGKKIVWIPMEAEYGEYIVQDALGHRLRKRREIDERILGNTASDGVSRIFPSAFTSPGELALIINHE